MSVVEIDDTERMKRAVTSLREFIRDKRELNRLLMGQFESNDSELRMCIAQAVTDWNMSPPLIPPITLKTHPNKYLLLQCAAIQALTSAGIWHSREHMPGSDGGTSGDDHAKSSEYSGWIERLEQRYERQKSDLKTAINIALAYNQMGVMSEYGTWQTAYGEWW